MTVEFSPLLANPVVAEVALLDEPSPQDGVVEVPLGEPVTLTYDVRAEFTSASQVGFDGLRLSTPEPVEFQRFEMGEPLVDDLHRAGIPPVAASMQGRVPGAAGSLPQFGKGLLSYSESAGSGTLAGASHAGEF